MNENKEQKMRAVSLRIPEDKFEQLMKIKQAEELKQTRFLSVNQVIAKAVDMLIETESQS